MLKMSIGKFLSFVYNKETNIVLFASTIYQLLIMNFLAQKIKEEFQCDNSIKMILIYSDYLEDSLKYFKLKMWSKLISIRDGKVFKIEEITKYPWRWIRYKQIAKIDIDKACSELKCVNFFIFGSPNAGLVKEVIQKFPNAIFICAEVGTASYISDKEYKKNWYLVDCIKKVIMKLKIDKIFKINVGGEYKGAREINILLDTKPHKISSVFSKNRILGRINLKECHEKFDSFLNYENIKINKILRENERIILFFSQALSESGFVSEESEVDFFQELARISRSKKINIYVKPHMQDSERKLNKIKKDNLIILENLREVPFEIISDMIKVRYIGLFFSNIFFSAYEKKVASKYFLFNTILFGKNNEKNKLFMVNDKAVSIPATWEEFLKQL